MEACVLIDNDGRIKAAVTGGAIPGGKNVTIPSEVDVFELHNYRLVNGMFIYDPIPEKEPQPTEEERISQLEEENKHLKEALDLLLSGETEEGEADG